MKTKNILCAFLTVAFVLGSFAGINAQSKIYVHKKNKTADEYNIADLDSISFTPPAGADYSKLKLNEVSGVGDDPDKFYELINIGTADINLAGCKIYYQANSSTGGDIPDINLTDANLTWTGSTTQSAAGGRLFSLIGRNASGSFTRGLTAQRILVITLTDPDGNIIDQCIRAEDAGTYAITDKSFSRIPDGTGPFYFTTPTPDALNGTSATGLIQVPTTQGIPEPAPETLVINEVDGNGKFVEIYNSGTEAISLEGYSLVKNEASTWWTGKATTTIAAGGYYTIAQSGGANGADEYNGASGISPKQNVKFELKSPDGKTVVDYFARTNGGNWGNSVTPDYGAGTPYSFSRCPDGTGDFQLAVPSCNAANNASAGDIVTNP
ncbi:MAG: lamin tail domain-containing protein [Candidatus Azobacteroides sp.]|nr:lamin tail domain-containing protein [Candidatus Azobacteroides sp.]